MPDRPTRRDGFGGGDDGAGIDAVVRVEIRDRTRLPEVLDAERTNAMSAHRTKPAECRGMAIDDGDDAAMPWQAHEQPFDVAAGMDEAAFPRPPRRGPAGIESIGRSDREQADVAAVFGH